MATPIPAATCSCSAARPWPTAWARSPRSSLRAARARNYAANTYPFRASSHFLYLFGIAAERDGFGLWDGTSWTLYLPARTADDALWEGPRPSLDDLAAAT